jgi:hypothetical protein
MGHSLYITSSMIATSWWRRQGQQDIPRRVEWAAAETRLAGPGLTGMLQQLRQGISSNNPLCLFLTLMTAMTSPTVHPSITTSALGRTRSTPLQLPCYFRIAPSDSLCRSAPLYRPCSPVHHHHHHHRLLLLLLLVIPAAADTHRTVIALKQVMA